MLAVLALLAAGAANAQTCDAKQMAKDLKDASPVAVPRKFLDLAACDPAIAKENAALALSKTLHGDEGNQAALKALEVGAQTAVMDWVDKLEPDNRSQSMMWMGEKCGTVPAVGQFFVDSAAKKREPFVKERWYRGMSKCRVPAVQDLLKQVVEQDAWKLSREQMFGFIEVYARNLGKDAIPHLRSAVGSMGDPKEIRLVINAFGDAANVGGSEGIDAGAAKEAIAAIEAIAPQTHPEAIDQARDTLLALGAEDKANEVVKYRWADRLQGGTYAWGVVATEDVTCKNGKKQVLFHYGKLTDVSRWPDALQASLTDAATKAWGLQAAAKCKGTGEVKIEMTPEPASADAAAWDAWLKPHREAFEKAAKGAWKSEEIDEGTKPF